MGFDYTQVSWPRAPRQPCLGQRVEGQGNNYSPSFIMKNAILLLAACAFTTASFAQTPETTVKVRDNGTKKIVTEKGDVKTVTKTGKTNTGKALENSADAAGNVAEKAGNGIKKGFKKGTKAVKRTTQKAGKKTVEATDKMEAKSE